MNLKIMGKCISKDNEKVVNKQGRFFLSSKFKDYAKDVVFQALIQIKGMSPLIGDLSVEAIFVMSDKRHADLTNLPKGIFDALNGIAWEDDRQIKKCQLLIIYGKTPRVLLNIAKLEQSNGT